MLKSRWVGASADGGRREGEGGWEGWKVGTWERRKVGRWERGKVGRLESWKGAWGEMLCPGEEKGLSITVLALKKI